MGKKPYSKPTIHFVSTETALKKWPQLANDAALSKPAEQGEPLNNQANKLITQTNRIFEKQEVP